MVIERIDEKKLLIVLEEKDMDELGLKYENISWSDQKSRDIMAKLLALAKIETGFSIDNYKLSIETLPQFNGCIIIFTLMNGRSSIKVPKVNDTNLSKDKIKMAIYKFDNLSDVLKVCEQLCKLRELEICKSDIYTYKNEYYLVMRPYKKMNSSIYIMLSEYGKTINQSEAFVSYLEEHGRAIKKHDAVVSIGRYM